MCRRVCSSRSSIASAQPSLHGPLGCMPRREATARRWNPNGTQTPWPACSDGGVGVTARRWNPNGTQTARPACSDGGVGRLHAGEPETAPRRHSWHVVTVGGATARRCGMSDTGALSDALTCGFRNHYCVARWHLPNRHCMALS